MIVKENNLTITHSELVKEWHPTKNGDLLPEHFTHGSTKEVWWKCHKCGHEWQAKIINRSRGARCTNKECSEFRREYKRKFKTNNITVTHPEIAKEWHPTKNEGKDITTFTAGSQEYVWWKCLKCGYEWRAIIARRIANNSGCPRELSISKKSFQEYIIDYFLSEYTDVLHSYKIGNMELDCFLPKYNIGIEYDGSAWHQNVKQDLKKNQLCKKMGITLYRVREIPLTELNDSSIDILCLPNDKDLSRVISILIKQIFNKKKTINIFEHKVKIENLREHHCVENSLATKYPHIAAEWHPTKNGNLKPEDFSYASRTRVWWKCSKCGNEWSTKIYSRTLTNSMCPAVGCREKKRKIMENNITVTHPDLAKEWHPTKNEGKDIRTFTAGSRKRVWWKCSKCGHEWQTKIQSRCLQGTGCPSKECRKNKSK